ncbi:hypothetical protein SLA2020_084040 [Shorea laevis]
MARFDDLTQHLVIEILLRLPADSLMQLKFVSKSWHCLIGNPLFVAGQHNYYARSPSRYDNLCILLQPHCLDTRLNVFKKSVTDGEDNDFPNFRVVTLRLPLNNDNANFQIVGFCDVIICLYNQDKVILANPVIRELRILPNSCISPCSELESRSIIGVGFGYDLKTNEYKVVRVYKDRKKGDCNFPPQRRAEVYSLSVDSWKEIDGPVMEMKIDNVVWEVPFIYRARLQRYWNGAYYWLGSTSDPLKKVIVLFDITCEVFQYMTLPESCYELRGDCNLIELNGSPALSVFFWKWEENCQGYFDIGTMNEFGANGTWTKLMRIGPLWRMGFPLTLFIRGNKLLMLYRGQIVSYDLTTKQMKKLPPYGEAFQTWIFKKSLVSLTSH